MNDTSCLINIENLTREFDRPNDRPLTVLAGVSLTVSSGDAIALMGLNGSGKTTLFRIIAGELFPTSGSIFFHAQDATRFPAHKRARFLGRVHQDSHKSLASDLTVEETLTLASRRNSALSLSFPRTHDVVATIRSYSEQAAEFVEFRKHLVTRTLSGGQRQLLAIITAILGRPRVLLLDEHQASLDHDFKQVSNDLVRRFVMKEGNAFVAISHDRAWTTQNARKTWLLSNGTVSVAEGGGHE